jgi:hypothetical protein
LRQQHVQAEAGGQFLNAFYICRAYIQDKFMPC